MKRFLPIFVLGLVIKLFLIPISLHPDLRAFALGSYLISQKVQVFSFYDYISRLPRQDPLVSLYGDDLFIYPPLAYLTPAIFMTLASPLYPWPVFDQLISDIGQVYGQPGLPLLLYLLKLPYLVPDLLGLYIVSRLFSKSKQLLPLTLWWLNPLVLYSAYSLGQTDIYIACFVLLAVWASTSRRPILAPIFMGLAAGFKPFPLLLLPFLPGSLLKNLGLGLATFLVIILPYLGSPGFRQYALLAPQTDKLLFAKIPVSGSQYLSLFFVGLVILFWLSRSHRHLLPDWAWLMAPLLLFFSVTHFHPQWFTWLSPFLLLALTGHVRTRLPISVLLAGYILIVLLFEPSLNFGLFGINFSFSNWLSGFYPPDQLASIIRSVLAGTSFYLLTPLSRDAVESK